MKHNLNRIPATAAAIAALVCGAASAASATPASEATAWQHRSAIFNFAGFTSAYTCDGMEGKVRQIMTFLGARKDMKVSANGCPRGPDSLSHMVWVKVEFDTLVPAPAGAAASDMVPAQWTAFRLNGQRPFFMDAGDCELIEAMKPMLTTNFSLRALDYRTSCTPHEVSFADFRVNGQVLKADPGHAG